METNGDALLCGKESKRQLETKRDYGDWRDCGDQGILQLILIYLLTYIFIIVIKLS